MGKAVLLLLVTSVGFALTSLHLVSELRSERAIMEALKARVSELEGMKAQARPAAPARSPFEIVPATEPPAAATTAPSARSANQAAGTLALVNVFPAPPTATHHEHMQAVRDAMERQRALLRDPDFRAGMLAQHRMMMSNNYPDAAQELELTPRQTEELFTLLAEQQMRAQQEGMPQPYDSPPDAAAVQEMQRNAMEQQRASEAELRNLLGDAKFTAWKEYQSTLGARFQANQLRSMLASRGLPLQQELARPLVKAIADAQQRLIQDSAKSIGPTARLGVVTNGLAFAGPESPEKQLERMSQHNQRVRDAVAHLLTPEQLGVLEEQDDAQLQMQLVQMRMMRAQAEAEGRGDPVGSTVALPRGASRLVGL